MIFNPTLFTVDYQYREGGKVLCFTASLCKTTRVTEVVFCKKSVLKNFVKFTGKHLCQV